MVTMILLIDNLFDIYISELTEEIIQYDKNKDIQPPHFQYIFLIYA